MTKTIYEKMRKNLEEEEGKLFSVEELGKILDENPENIRICIHKCKLKFFTLARYDSSEPEMLVAVKEAVTILAKQTNCLKTLKALVTIIDGDASLGIVTVGDAEAVLEELR